MASGRDYKLSSSEFASPLVFVYKNTGMKRPCCPAQMDCVIEKLKGGQIFTTLDFLNGFFHVPVSLECQKYTSFVTQSGHYQFLFVPFGITKLFSSVYQAHHGKYAYVYEYMDDVIIASKIKSIGDGVHKEMACA